VTDVDGLLRGALRRHAEDAPAATGLLDAVHDRSRRLVRRRHRRAAAVGAGALVAVVAALVVAVPDRGGQHASTAPPSPLATAPASPWSSIAPPTVAAPPPATPTSSDAPLRLVRPGAAPPVFPFRPVVTPTGGLADPVVTLVGGELSAYFAAHDGVRGADVTIRVGPGRPAFDEPADRAGPVRETAQQVRGHVATLRTVTIAPANRLSLYWLEKPGQWVRVDTDDTLTDAEVVRLADALAPAALPVSTPLRFDLVPAGMDLDTSTLSAMVFRPPGGSAVTCRLLAAQSLSGATVPVGPYQGTLRRTDSGATLTVARTDRDATLVVQVPARYPVTDAGLIRFAAGVHITDSAEPAS
jgi:hypothetical protein